MRRSDTILLSFFLILAGTACATRTTSSPPPVPTSAVPTTLQVGMSDTGSSVTLHVGDHLVITLPKVGSPIPGAPSAWYMAPYPADLLEPGPATPLEGRFEFVAKAKGSGEIKLFGGCWPGPVTDERPSCPNSVVPGSSPLPAVFSLTVNVT
jgi:hypothetical protein